MPIGKDSARLIITISKDLKEKLEIVAKQDKRSASNYIVKLIEKDIEKAAP